MMATFDDVAIFIFKLFGIMKLALDLETDGLHPWGGRILLLTLTDGVGPIVHIRGDDLERILTYKAILKDPTIPKIMHRSSFDATWIAVHYGIFIQNICDTKLQELVLQGEGEYGQTSLKDCLIKYKLATLDKEVVQSFVGKQDYEFTEEQIYYAAQDVAYLHALDIIQEGLLKERGLWTLAKLENRVAEVTYRMRVSGINFDAERWMRIANGYTLRYKYLEQQLDIAFNNRRIIRKSVQMELLEETIIPEKLVIVTKWSSPAQVKKRFKIKSFDDLPSIAGTSPEADMFLEFHSLSKYVSTYGDSWLMTERGPTVADDGKVHCDFNQIVSTGRYSSMYPNMQNLPKLTEHRRCFIPSKGKVFVSGDFSGQELAIMAYGSQEPTWLNAMREGKDVHSMMAVKFFPSQWQQAKLKTCTFPFKCNCPGHLLIRDKAKVFNFGLPYGKGPMTIAEDLGIPEHQARQLVKTLKQEAPVLSAWLKRNGESAVSNKETYTLDPFYRYRDLKRAPEDWMRRNQGFNTPVQGTGADMLKLALWNVHQARIKGSSLLLQIHDEILTECYIEDAFEWSEILKEQMEGAAALILEPGLVKIKPTIAQTW